MISTLLGMAAGAVANIWGGYEHGDRYTAGLAIAAIVSVVVGSWVIGLATGLGFILWRLVGWQKALDMGRNPGEVDLPSYRLEIIRDHAVMFAIAMIPALILAVAAKSLFGLLLAPAITLSYSAGMWLIPYDGKWDNIRWAEGFSGAMFILIPALVA